MVFSQRRKTKIGGKEREREREEFVARSFQFGVVLLKGEGKFTARGGKGENLLLDGARLREASQRATVKLRRKSNNDGPRRCGRETARPVLSE